MTSICPRVLGGSGLVFRAHDSSWGWFEVRLEKAGAPDMAGASGFVVRGLAVSVVVDAEKFAAGQPGPAGVTVIAGTGLPCVGQLQNPRPCPGVGVPLGVVPFEAVVPPVGRFLNGEGQPAPDVAAAVLVAERGAPGQDGPGVGLERVDLDGGLKHAADKGVNRARFVAQAQAGEFSCGQFDGRTVFPAPVCRESGATRRRSAGRKRFAGRLERKFQRPAGLWPAWGRSWGRRA